MRGSNFIWVWGKGNIAKIRDLGWSTSCLPDEWTMGQARTGVLLSQFAACYTRRWWHSAIHGRVGTLRFPTRTSLVTRFILFMANGGGKTAGRTGPKREEGATNTTAGDRLRGLLGRFWVEVYYSALYECGK
jgi:hypothetical protein